MKCDIESVLYLRVVVNDTRVISTGDAKQPLGLQSTYHSISISIRSPSFVALIRSLGSRLFPSSVLFDSIVAALLRMLSYGRDMLGIAVLSWRRRSEG
jgi:hypothetical protein